MKNALQLSFPRKRESTALSLRGVRHFEEVYLFSQQDKGGSVKAEGLGDGYILSSDARFAVMSSPGLNKYEEVPDAKGPPVAERSNLRSGSKPLHGTDSWRA